MAEVHVIGEIVGGKSFPGRNIFCKFYCGAGDAWSVLEGEVEGQTQVDCPLHDNLSCWSHPIDIHYGTKGIKGWPKIHVEVYHLDAFGRSEIYAYGCCYIPCTPGPHQIEVQTWRPISSTRDRITQFFLGGGPELRSPELVYTGVDRYRLQTQSMGTVHLEMNILFKNFRDFGVEY